MMIIRNYLSDMVIPRFSNMPMTQKNLYRVTKDLSDGHLFRRTTIDHDSFYVQTERGLHPFQPFNNGRSRFNTVHKESHWDAFVGDVIVNDDRHQITIFVFVYKRLASLVGRIKRPLFSILEVLILKSIVHLY